MAVLQKERTGGVLISLTIGRWARRWINHCCLWRIANATPDLPSITLYSFAYHEGWPGWVDLGGWLHTEIVYPPEDGHPSGTVGSVSVYIQNNCIIKHTASAESERKSAFADNRTTMHSSLSCNPGHFKLNNTEYFVKKHRPVEIRHFLWNCSSHLYTYVHTLYCAVVPVKCDQC